SLCLIQSFFRSLFYTFFKISKPAFTVEKIGKRISYRPSIYTAQIPVKFTEKFSRFKVLLRRLYLLKSRRSLKKRQYPPLALIQICSCFKRKRAQNKVGIALFL